MKQKNMSFQVQSLKPRNPMGAVKMTGGGKHITSQKTLRQKGKKQINNFMSDGSSDNKKGSYKEPFLISNLIH